MRVLFNSKEMKRLRASQGPPGNAKFAPIWDSGGLLKLSLNFLLSPRVEIVYVYVPIMYTTPPGSGG